MMQMMMLLLLLAICYVDGHDDNDDAEQLACCTLGLENSQAVIKLLHEDLTDEDVEIANETMITDYDQCQINCCSLQIMCKVCCKNVPGCEFNPRCQCDQDDHDCFQCCQGTKDPSSIIVSSLKIINDP